MPDRKFEVGLKEAYAPKDAIDAFVKGLDYPFEVRVKNESKKGLLLPNVKEAGVIAAGQEVTVVVHSYAQVWGLVSDAAGIADIKGREKLVTLSVTPPTKKAAEAGGQ